MSRTITTWEVWSGNASSEDGDGTGIYDCIEDACTAYGEACADLYDFAKAELMCGSRPEVTVSAILTETTSWDMGTDDEDEDATTRQMSRWQHTYTRHEMGI